MNEIDVTARSRDGTARPVTLAVARMVNCGRAWREPPDEAGPVDVDGTTQDTAPVVVPKPPHLLTTDTALHVNASDTYGEAEFVLFPTADAVYVAVGLDLKYGAATELALNTANSTCPSVISCDVWTLDDVRDGWDDIELRSWTGTDGEWRPYQVATLDAFLEPDTLLARVESKLSVPIERTMVWSSTVGTVDDELQGVNPSPSIRVADFYAAQLYDPAANRRLLAQCDVRVNDWVDGVTL